MKAIIPTLTYNNVTAAIDWLCNAFGFQRHLIILGKDGKIVHPELTFGNVMIMVGPSESGTEYSQLIKTPGEFGGMETQSPYIVSDDLDTLYTNAKKNGAKIAIDIKIEEYGGRGFTCYDPEGHIWNFGSYDPWKTENKNDLFTSRFY